jgi:hypothetical protein
MTAMPAASKESVLRLCEDEDRAIHIEEDEGERKIRKVKTREMCLRCGADTWLCYFVLSGYKLLTVLRMKMM